MVAGLLPPGKTAQKTARAPNGRFGHGNSGGKKGRSGRKPSTFLQQCREYAKDIPDFWQRVADGTELECRGVNEAGELVYGEPRMADRLTAAKMLVAYGHGQPVEHVLHEGEITSYVVTSPTMPTTIDQWRKMFAPSKS